MGKVPGSDVPVFFDHAAGEAPRPEIAARYAELAARLRYNPHGLTCYSEGCRRALLQAECELLTAAGVPRDEAQVVWCASGTEALNLAMRGYCWRKRDGIIAADAAAHPALRNTAADLGHAVEYFLPARTPRLPAAEMVALSLVNNETGAVWPGRGGAFPDGALLLVDAAQALGKMALPWRTEAIDMLVLSGRKIGGPASAAALVLRRSTVPALRAVVTGGGQQHGWRSGTVDVVSAVLFAEAARLAEAERATVTARVASLNRQLRAGIMERGWPVFSPDNGSPYILAFAIPGCEGALVTRILAADYGIVVGAGSACSAESGEVSPALSAEGTPEALARGMIRVSFSGGNTPQEVSALLEALEAVRKNY